MGNVTSHGLGRGGGGGGGKSLRRQQKHQQPTPTITTTTTPAHYSQQQQQKARVKAKRNKLNNNRRQLVSSHHHLYPLGRASSRPDLEHNRDLYRNWSPEPLAYLDGGHLPTNLSNGNHSNQHRALGNHYHHHLNYQDLHIANTRRQFHRVPFQSNASGELISSAASSELISHTHSNSSSSTAPALDQPYDRIAFSAHHHHNDFINSNNSNYHQNPSTSYYNDQDDQCDPVPVTGTFHQVNQLTSGLHITQPPSQCLDSCCNFNINHQTTTTASNQLRRRTMNSPTQQTRRASGGANQSRRAQNGASNNNGNGGGGGGGDDGGVCRSTLSADLERGLAFDESERSQRGLLGLLPAAYQNQELQAAVVMKYIEDCQDELAKYVYLRNVKDFNENLFYFTLTRNVERLMPLVYTPTVGLACQRFSQIYLRPRGLFVTANDAGRVGQLVANWPQRDVRVIVMTDGERILGLGDLGANGMGISIGKLSLYTALAGIAPRNVMPVTIDVGTNNDTLLQDPFYIGLRQRRLRGDPYETLIDEFMEACVKRWGRSCLIQFEDFANSTAFNLLERHRRNYCTFNDDIQGTASVSLSGLITAARQVGKRLSAGSYLFYGAGEANLGTANLLIMAMCDEGLTRDEAKRRIWLVDSKGLVVTSRDDLNGHKRQLAQTREPIKELEAIIDLVKPSAIVGASAQGGSFSESICKKMAQYNERPIIFALSNPTSKAECTAQQAYDWTSGNCVFASGSPFEPVRYNGQTFVTGQGNNAYIFPGVGLASIAAHTHVVPEEAFLVAARALSDQVTQDDLQVGLVYPNLSKIREVTLKVATRVLEYLYAERLATYRPEPSDKEAFLRSIQYDPSY